MGVFQLLKFENERFASALLTARDGAASPALALRAHKKRIYSCLRPYKNKILQRLHTIRPLEQTKS